MCHIKYFKSKFYYYFIFTDEGIFKQNRTVSDVLLLWDRLTENLTVSFNCLLFCLNLLILSPNLIWICQRLFGCVVKTWIQNAKQCGKILFSIAFLLFKYVALFSFETDLAGIWLSLFSFTGTLFVNREHSSHTFLYIYLLYQINQFSKLI